MKNTPSKILNVFVLMIFIASILILYNKLKGYSLSDIIDSLKLISSVKLILSGIITAINYLIVCGYDVLAFKYMNISLKMDHIISTAFISNAVSNVTGYSMISGGAVRYRLYSRWHIPFAVVAEAVLFNSLTLWIGLFMVGGLMFAIEPAPISQVLHVPVQSVRLLGMLFVSLVAGYVLFSMSGKNSLKIGKWRMRVPSPAISLGQVVISSADWFFAALALYVLLPRASVSFFAFLGVYLPAQLLAILSQVPAGLGVFETVVLLTFPRTHTRPEVFAALLLFRVIYYLLPFGVAMMLLILRRKR